MHGNKNNKEQLTIGKDCVGFSNVTKLGLGERLSLRIRLVRVPLERHLAIALLDFAVGGRALDAQDLIVGEVSHRPAARKIACNGFSEMFETFGVRMVES
jgi:hypothetical protein